MSTKSTFLLLLAVLLTLTIITTTAQQVSTDPITIDCLDASTYSYTPSQAAEGFCGASERPDCQDVIELGYPNTFGPVGAAANTGPFTFSEQLTNSPLWITISDTLGRPAYKTRFFLQVDRYSLLELGGSAGDSRFDVGTFDENAFISDTDGILINGTSISAEFAGWTTFSTRRAYIRETSSTDTDPPTNEDRKVVDFYTLVIELDRGVVSDFFWETGCYGCPSSDCWDEEGWCTLPYSLCSIVDTTSDISCNIKLYVGWRGTDSNGNYLISAEQTMRNFLQFDVSTPFESARSAFGSLAPAEDEF